MMRNVGYKEAKKISNYDCYIFNDVDTVIENDKNLYKCPSTRTKVLHMAPDVDIFEYRYYILMHCDYTLKEIGLVPLTENKKPIFKYKCDIIRNNLPGHARDRQKELIQHNTLKSCKKKVNSFDILKKITNKKTHKTKNHSTTLLRHTLKTKLSTFIIIINMLLENILK